MRERLAGLIGEDQARDATIGTFHAICARILRRDGTTIGLSRSFTIYDRADQVALLKQVLRQLGLDEKRFSPAGMLAWIGRRKDELADVATAKRQAANFYDETAARVYEAYQNQLREDDAVDFDDLLNRVVDLFEQHTDVLAKYQNRWQQILVDEYQDTNRAQYLICRHLAAKHKNLAVVGDDDQSIYSWRGADLRNILDFEADYPDARAGRGVHALRDPVPAGGRDALLRAARGQGRARLCAAGAQPGRPGGAGADRQRAGSRDRREDARGAARLGGVARHHLVGSGRGSGPEREPGDPFTRLAGWLRGVHAPADGDGAHRTAERAVRRGARAQRPQGFHQRRDR